MAEAKRPKVTLIAPFQELGCRLYGKRTWINLAKSRAHTDSERYRFHVPSFFQLQLESGAFFTA